MQNMKQTHSLAIPRIDALDTMDDIDTMRSLLDDKGARAEIANVNWPSEFPYRPLASVSVAYSSHYIWLDFLVRCNYLKAENWEDQSPVSQDSCVEFFVDPLSDGEYWNFEFNCIGAINASRRRERPAPTRLTSEQLATIVRHPSCGSRPFREVEGLFTWSLLVGIPLDLLGFDPDNPPAGATGNFYKCASKTSDPHYLSWAPIATPKPDFHRPEFFGRLSFIR